MDRKPPKPKKCRACKEKFTPRNSMQVVCSPACALKLAKAKSEKYAQEAKRQQKRSDRARKEALLSKSDWLKRAQKAFNAYIRERDKDLPCISCDIMATKDRRYLYYTGGYWDCGHYRSVGSCPELRFEPLNAHKQCKRCNSQLSGNVVEYRTRLLQRIGADKLAWVEGSHEPKRYRIDDLKAIEREYKDKLKALKS